ncbi:MAG: excinuclease ABC subunit B [Elusimicrobia bacterium RIFOXYA2_FULL_39_19]|nr:MAG: excinuclease ABC subunit B [Elusimicrobia bacterium RIFOXYA2_FULL_39_19]
MFKLVSDFKPAGDQPQAIEEILKAFNRNEKHQVLLGVTGSGKTFTMANVIRELQKPTLIMSHNKVLAAQLYAEFKQFFPENAVEYFVSYYDYYQPEAYVPHTDTYIEKDASINQHIDRLRLKATSSLIERKDVIVVASVSCIYNIGSPTDFKEMCVFIEKGSSKNREQLLKELIAIRYERNDLAFERGKIRSRGNVLEVWPAYLETALRIEFDYDEIKKVAEINPVNGKALHEKDKTYIFPASHFVVSPQKYEDALKQIELELEDRLAYFKKHGKLLEAQRLEMRTKYDLELMRETGFCHGIENYSRYLAGRPKGERPFCLIDYFGDDYLLIIDESHVSVPQIYGMYEGDRSRKQVLVDFGFRLPSAMDNRPLKFNEFEKIMDKAVYVSATPGKYELNKTKGVIVEQVIRPTGLVDPEVEIRPIESQVDDLVTEVEKCAKNKFRTLVTTLTKAMAEDLTEYLQQKNLRVRYLHSDIDALDRIEILKDLRKGNFDCLVGVNLLREGLDLPEVALVAVLDADKEGFLRSETSLIQVCGRAARNISGRVILYADKITGSMKRATDEMNRRRALQVAYNKKHHITPKTIIKGIQELEEFQYKSKDLALSLIRDDGMEFSGRKNLALLKKEIEEKMKQAADSLDFELAAVYRDKLYEIKEMSAGRKNNIAKKFKKSYN